MVEWLKICFTSLNFQNLQIVETLNVRTGNGNGIATKMKKSSLTEPKQTRVLLTENHHVIIVLRSDCCFKLYKQQDNQERERVRKEESNGGVIG